MKEWDNIKILIVEDDPDNLELLSRLLQINGASVVKASTGNEAVEQIKMDTTIKLVLMDIKLPDIDGFETTKKIKLLRPNLPVIAQTAYAQYEDRERCLESGCDDYVSKPIKKSILFEKINNYIYN